MKQYTIYKKAGRGIMERRFKKYHFYKRTSNRT